MEWNEDSIARLRALWADGHSTAEIGRRLAVSKNAVVGKAHRLGLAARPSPIRRDGAAAPRGVAPRRVTGSTLPPLPANAATPMSGPTAPASAPSAQSAAKPAPAIMTPPVNPTTPALAAPAPTDNTPPPPPAMRVVTAVRSGRSIACCWPIGEPGTKTFRFCDDDALQGKPYCAEHAQLAYVKVRDRREEAA